MVTEEILDHEVTEDKKDPKEMQDYLVLEGMLVYQVCQVIKARLGNLDQGVHLDTEGYVDQWDDLDLLDHQVLVTDVLNLMV